MSKNDRLTVAKAAVVEAETIYGAAALDYKAALVETREAYIVAQAQVAQAARAEAAYEVAEATVEAARADEEEAWLALLAARDEVADADQAAEITD